MQTHPLAWVTGAGGLIGNYLIQLAPQFAPGWRVRGLRHAELDLLDFSAVRTAFTQDRPDLVFHCAAISFPPDCHKDPDLARRVNVDATAFLAELAADVPFFFFSTDLVFDGRKGNYVETDPVNPLTIYAETKVAAEQSVLANRKHTVIRTSLNGGTSPAGRRAFNEQLRHAFRQGETLRLFTDEFRSPIAATETVRAVWEFAIAGRTGLYHIAGAERLSRWEIGTLLAARWPRLNPKIEAMSIQEFQGPPRAPDTSLDCAQASKLLSFPLPRFSEWLAAHPDVEF